MLTNTIGREIFAVDSFRGFMIQCIELFNVTSQSPENHASTILVYRSSSQAMVLCAVIGCFKLSGRDKNVSFYRILKVIAIISDVSRTFKNPAHL